MKIKNGAGFLNRFISSPKLYLTVPLLILIFLIAFTKLFDIQFRLSPKFRLPQKPTVQVSKCSESEEIEKTKKSVVRVVGEYGMGSGVIIDTKGYILTNNHVVEYEEMPMVALTDGKSYAAEVIGGNAFVDLAVLKIEGKALPAITWGDVDTLTQGETLYAIGYPLDIEGDPTITKGSFSAKRHDSYNQIDYVQTDAAINAGSSGGALVNSCGKLVGINTVSITETKGINFAISSIHAEQIGNKLIASAGKPRIAKKIAENKGQSLTPLQTVQLFYDYISLRRLPEAYELYSKNQKSRVAYEEWKRGYDNTINNFLTKAEEVLGYPSKIEIELFAIDFSPEGKVVVKSFTGGWELVLENDRWKLDFPNIVEVAVSRQY